MKELQLEINLTCTEAMRIRNHYVRVHYRNAVLECSSCGLSGNNILTQSIHVISCRYNSPFRRGCGSKLHDWDSPALNVEIVDVTPVATKVKLENLLLKQSPVPRTDVDMISLNGSSVVAVTMSS